jgi:hypothetical protein
MQLSLFQALSLIHVIVLEQLLCAKVKYVLCAQCSNRKQRTSSILIRVLYRNRTNRVHYIYGDLLDWLTQLEAV